MRRGKLVSAGEGEPVAAVIINPMKQDAAAFPHHVQRVGGGSRPGYFFFIRLDKVMSSTPLERAGTSRRR